MKKNDKKITIEDIKIKELLEHLDIAINPFSKTELEMLSQKEYDNGIKIFHKSFNEELEVIIMQDYHTETWTAYEKDGNRIKHTIDYIEQDGKNVQIEHTVYQKQKCKTEEYIKMTCSYEDLKDPRNVSVEYRVKHKMLKKITSNNANKNLLIEELEKAIQKAKTLTNELISEKEVHVKKYIRP